MLQRIVDQVLNRDDGLLLGNLHRRGGDDIGLRQQRIVNAAADRILHEQLLQLQVVLRDDQVLLVGGNDALRTHHLNRRHGAHLRLSFRVFQGLLRIGERLLLHANIFVGEHQIPVHIFDLIDRGDDLQAEGNVGNLAVVLGDADEARIGQGPESLQKVLRDPQLEVGAELTDSTGSSDCWWSGECC